MSDYAIIEAGSKQYKVEPNSILEIETFDREEGQTEVTLDKVLFVRNGEKVEVGAPTVANAKVVCDFVDDIRTKKVYTFKFRRRKNSHRIRGHRQNLTRLKVKEIIV